VFFGEKPVQILAILEKKHRLCVVCILIKIICCFHIGFGFRNPDGSLRETQNKGVSFLGEGLEVVS
jgi:hypothetical protein